jgi:hypothetical protein
MQYILAILGVLLKCEELVSYGYAVRKSIYALLLPSFLALPYAFKLILLLVIRSTYSTVFNLIRFILISRLRANNGLLLVRASIGSLSPLIYLTLAISRLLYN